MRVIHTIKASPYLRAAIPALVFACLVLGNTVQAQPSLTVLSSLPTGKSAESVAISDKYAFVVDLDAGLVVVDIRNPRNPVILASAPTSAPPVHVFLHGLHAYVSLADSGMDIFDVSRPRFPQHVTQFLPPAPGGYTMSAFVVDDLAYLADYAGALLVLNVRNPQIPLLVGSAFMDAPALDVFVLGNKAYVANHALGLQIFDVSNPAFPVLLGSVDTPGFARSVVVSGSHAYVADNQGGLQVINVSNPSKPFIEGSASGVGVVQRVDIQGQYAYLASGVAGLFVVDVKNPKSPSVVKSLRNDSEAYDLSLAAHRVFMANGPEGLKILGKSNRGSAIGGYIKADGKSVPSASVVLNIQGAGGEEAFRAQDTNAVGGFRFGGIRAGSYSVHFQNITATRNIYGRIDLNGDAYPKLKAELYRKVGNRLVLQSSVVTNAKGVFSFKDLRQGTYTVSLAPITLP